MDTSASRKVKKNVAYKSIVSQQQVVPCYVVLLGEHDTQLDCSLDEGSI